MRRHLCALVLAAVVGLLAIPGPPVFAQAGAPAASDLSPDLAQLKSRAERRFQIMPVRRGLVLVPRSDASRVRTVEIADGQVLVDGSPMTGRELRDKLGDDAAIVGQLSFLDADSRRRMFSEADAATPPQPPEPPSAPAPAAAPSAPARDDGWSETERYRRGGARFRLGGDITVKEGEAVGSDVVAVLGTIHVNGRVDGDVVAVGGSVSLGPKAVVRGGVTSVGGAIERASGSQVGGEINEVRIASPSFGPVVRMRPWREWTWFSNPFGASADLVGTLVRVGLLGLVAALIVALVPGPVRRVADRASAEPWRAGLVGLAAQLLFVPLLVLTVVVLAVSIIGIPLLLLVPFGLVAVFFGFLLGFAGAGCAIGELIGRRSSPSAQSLIVSLVVGLAVVFGLTVLARVGGLAGLPMQILLSVVLFVGFLIEYLAWTVGFGAVLLSRFGRRGSRSSGAFVPPPVPGFDAGSGAPSSL